MTLKHEATGQSGIDPALSLPSVAVLLPGIIFRSHAVVSVAAAFLRRPLVAITALLLAIAAGPAAAQGWLPTSWFSPSEMPDPEAMHPLAERDGPWLVLATTFQGETARADARKLAQELRARHKMQAYTHEKAFDYTGEERGNGFNPDGTPKRMRYANAGQVVEVAVLVGDFTSFDDPRGQKALQQIKQLRPEALGGSHAKSRLVSAFLQANNGNTAAAAAKPPMHAAMLIPNPLMPDGYFSQQQVDDFVLSMNSDVKHSLLDCPGRYTVRVATFTGDGTFDTSAATSAPTSTGGLVDINRFVSALKGSGWQDPQLRGVEKESRLVKAAADANKLTEALRRAGWQAWEFHDRDSSIVCVGCFDQIAAQGADGRPVPHPEITRIVSGLGPDQEAMARGQVMPRSFGGIMLDMQPKPIDVPRRPVGRR